MLSFCLVQQRLLSFFHLSFLRFHFFQPDWCFIWFAIFAMQAYVLYFQPFFDVFKHLTSHNLSIPQLIGGLVAYRYRNMLDPFGSAPAGAPFAGAMWIQVNLKNCENCPILFLKKQDCVCSTRCHSQEPLSNKDYSYQMSNIYSFVTFVPRLELLSSHIITGKIYFCNFVWQKHSMKAYLLAWMKLYRLWN